MSGIPGIDTLVTKEVSILKIGIAMGYQKVSIPELCMEIRFWKLSIPRRWIEIGYRKVSIPKLVFDTSFFSSWIYGQKSENSFLSFIQLMIQFGLILIKNKNFPYRNCLYNYQIWRYRYLRITTRDWYQKVSIP